jgi:AP-1 complex subunit gamma-1
VALNTLIKVVAIEPNAVQRHRNTILECLRDPDISIRRRALDLSFTLIREDNVRVLIRELLAFLENADAEFKPVMTTQIGIAADRYSPSKRWHVDTMLRVVKLAGNYVKEQILSSFIRLIATTPELQQYAVQKLYAALNADITQEALTLAATWTIGEYGDALLKGGSYEEEELVKEVKESDIVDLYTTILNSTYANQVVTEYIITSAMKLSTRMSNQSQVERIRRLMASRTADLSVEIQQRAVEYGNLFAYDAIRRGMLERMPPPEIKEEQRVLGARATPSKDKRQSKILKSKTSTKVAKTTEQDMLLDLMGGSDVPAVDASATLNRQQNTADLLADILGGGSSVASPPPQTRSPVPAQSNTDSIMDLFGPSNGAAKAPAAAAAAPQGHPVYNKNSLQITMQVSRSAAGAQAQARFKNTGNFERFTNVGLQAAVPKSQKLTLQAINKNVLEGGEEATQNMRIVAATGVGFFHCI